MAKITLTPLANLQNETTAVNAINANNSRIETAIENTLSRDGTSPNQMGANLDMNSHQILNLPYPATEDSPIRLQDALTLGSGGTITPIPNGGTKDQVLGKLSSTDYDASWINALNIYNIQSYGGVDDGVSDNLAAFNAVKALITANGGGILWLPYTNTGVYSTTGAWRVDGMSNFVLDGDPGVVVKGTAAFDASDNLNKSSIISGLNFTGTAPVTGYIHKNMVFSRNVTVDGSLGNVSGLPPAAVGNFGYNMCSIEIMNVDNVRIYSASKGAFGNGPVISTHDPRLTAPSIQTWNITAAGSGYAVGDRFFSNDTGDQFSKAIFEVATINGSGGVTSVNIVSRGIYLTISGANATTTNITGTGTGCNLQILTYATARNGILNPVMECDIIDCCRGLLPSYDSVENPGGIAGSGLQIGAAYNPDVDVRLFNVGGPGLDLFNCTGGRCHMDVYSVSSTPIGATQARGSWHSDFGLSDMILSGNVPSVDIRGAMNNGLSYFFNGGTATPGPQRCFFDFVIDGSIAPDTIGTPGFRMMGGSISGLVGQAKDNFGSVIIYNSNGIAATLYDCVQNKIDFNIRNPGQIVGNYSGLKFFSQIDQAGGGCTDNSFTLRAIDTRPLVTTIVTTDGTTRHARNKFFPYNITVPTGAIFDLPMGSYQVYQERGFTTTATSAGTLVLDKNSDNIQVLTGATTHTVTLPVASTLPLGTRYTFYNESSGAVTVQSSGANTVLLLAGNSAGEVVLNTNSGTGAAIWTLRYFGTALFGGKKLTVQNTMTLSATDGSTIAFGAGGTVAYTGGNLSQFASTTSAQLAGVISDETGSGALVFANSPTLVTPVLGAATATTINGATIDNTAWTAYTPTVTSQGGTITAQTGAAGAFKITGKTAHVFATVTITTVGTATGSCIFTLPPSAPAVANNYAGTAYESGVNATSGACITVSSTNTAWARNATGTTMFVNGAVINITINYQIA